MEICQECYAIVPEHHTQCADCGAPIEQPEISPLAELDNGLNPDEFLRELLGEEQAGRPYFMPNPAPAEAPEVEETPFSFDPTAYPPPADAAVPPVAPPPPHPTSVSSLDEILSSRPKPLAKPAPIAPPPPPPRPPSFATSPDDELGSSHRGHSISKKGSTPTGAEGVYAVTARSNRLDKSATLGRSKHHNKLVASAAVAGLGVFAIGSMIGWLASNRVPNQQGLPAEVAFSDATSLPPAITSSFAVVQGVYCDGSTGTGFATSDLLLLPANKELTGTSDTGSVIGTTRDGRFLVIAPDTNQSSLTKGKGGKIPDGRAVFVADLGRLAAGGDITVTEVEVATSTRTRGGSFTTYFTDRELPPGMPVLDKAHNLVAVVDRSGTFAMTLGPLATELSSLKLSPSTVASQCLPAEPVEDTAEGE